MPYTITHTNGKIYATIPDGVVDSKLGLSLIGPNYVNYGQLIANNFVRLLENQANITPPSNPLAGQLWWNSEKNVLSYFDGNKFKPCSSRAQGTDPLLSPLSGDQWWDTTTNQLKVWNDSSWQLVGPSYTRGQGFSDLTPSTVFDTAGTEHLISSLSHNGAVYALVSSHQFELSVPINGIKTVKPGITLLDNTILNGTALNSQFLGNIAASNYVSTTATLTTLLGDLSVDNKLTIGKNTALVIADNVWGTKQISSDKAITVLSGNTSITVDSLSNTISVNAQPTTDSSVTTKLYVDSSIVSAVTDLKQYSDNSIDLVVAGSTIGTLAELAQSINNDPDFAINVAAEFDLKAPRNNPVLTGEILVSGNVNPTVDNTYNIGSQTKRIKKIHSTTISSVFADLAEIYSADDNSYASGTVVVFGGTEDITVSNKYKDHRIAGVISTNPGLLMNDDQIGVTVALTGKVPCFVIGEVTKGDILVNSSVPGVAVALSDTWVPGCVIGKSLEDNNDTDVRLVMVAVGRF